MIYPKKSLGQNFLFDKNICKKIVNLSKIYNQEIIEIGPGTGNLTDHILEKRPKKITLIEKDPQLYDLLKEKYSKINNLELINCDALKYNFNKNKKTQKIISNLPYNISIKIIFNLIKLNNIISEMILMIQKEVAEKMVYENNKKNNRLNTFMKFTSKFNIEFNVSNKVFYPKPKITSSVIRIIPKRNLNINIDKLENFTRDIFKHKRKKLSNVISIKSNQKGIIEILNKRAEDLDNKELKILFNKFYNF